MLNGLSIAAGVRLRCRAAPAVGSADREHRCAGTAVKCASGVKVAGHLSLWAGSPIVIRIRHRASFQILTGLLAGPSERVAAGRFTRHLCESLRAHRRSLALADEDEHVSVDHPLDDSEGRFERPPNRRQRDRSTALVISAGLRYRVRRCHLARATLAPPRLAPG